MVTVGELTDPYIQALTRVPSVSEGICRICRSVPNPGFSTCYSCSQTSSQVSRPVSAILPISLYAPGGQLHTLLRNYKDSPSQDVRRRGRIRLAAIVTRFLHEHRGCIADSGWDGIAYVPSTSGRADPHSLGRALSVMPTYGDEVGTFLAPGSERIDHNRARDEGFEVTRDVTDRELLLVDDTYTSGARVQSAASALQLAGAQIIGTVVVGRYFKPDFSDRHRTLWSELRSEQFDFGACGLE